ncbi:dihydrodipicolinate synthase family protein [Paramicrobacterium fandaimingii]|uniref:dihydrodipicolinate synthase family protein n=1 Tax=Paramicrobacterium fandaimingii TaxID=2708079 RepID=UPI00141EC1EB|nr:dihydrodipicolinate synthase family protein [Microbacterium fandaimingii]
MTDFTLLDTTGAITSTPVNDAPDYRKPTRALTSRTAFAASHVIPHAWADNTPGQPAEIDWDATLAFRHHVWSWGLGVADAMDTAQRNMGLDAVATRELITRSAAEAQSVGGSLVVGVNTDHIDEPSISLQQIIDAYTEQLHHAEDAGAGVVLMCSRHLARTATSAADYERVYGAVLTAASTPVVLHWLGEAFDPELTGYFGSTDWRTASDTVVRIIEASGGRVSGIKMSLLNAQSEISVRRRLPAETTMFTGDDFNYVDLIAGDDQGHSDALLGAFAAVAPSASAAIQALDAGDTALYRSILTPTEELSRQVFAAPTFYYKAGVAFLSWLNGHQNAFSMVGGLHSARSLPHLSEIVRLANASGALERPELAAARWNGLLAVNGVTA